MNSKVSLVTKQLSNTISKNSPTILTGLSVAGLISTVVLAVKATPKALTIIDIQEELTQSYLTKKEVIQRTWKCYIPAAMMGGVTIGCLISANSINLRRNAALASIYSLTEASLKEYHTKVVETIGETKAGTIKDSIMQDRVNNNPVDCNEIIMTGKGEQLCYDSISGRYFKNDIEQIRRVQNDLNRALLTDMWCSLNELYYGLGLSPVSIGEEMGWSPDAPIEIDFGSMLTANGEPCLVLDYWTNPKHDYREY